MGGVVGERGRVVTLLSKLEALHLVRSVRSAVRVAEERAVLLYSWAPGPWVPFIACSMSGQPTSEPSLAG